MYTPIVWVARPDGTGWNGTRPRDVSDYSYCVYRESETHYAKLVVRDTYTNNPKARARRIVGEFYFDTHKEAKLAVITAINSVDNHPMGKDVARTAVMDMLNSVSKSGSLKSGTGPSLSKWYANPMNGAVTFSTHTVISAPEDEPVHIGELAQEVMENAIQNMTESIAEVQEAVEPAFDPSTWSVGEPVPSGYIAMGNKLVKLGWPS